MKSEETSNRGSPKGLGAWDLSENTISQWSAERIKVDHTRLKNLRGR